MNKIIVSGYVVGMMQTNCWFLHREGRQETVAADPGDNGRELAEAAAQQGLRIIAILLTHAHFDHIGGVREMVEATGAPVYLCDQERLLDHDPQANLSAIYRRPMKVQPDVRLRDGEEAVIADMTFRCLHTPGHTEGSCCYYIEETGSEEDAAGDARPCAPILVAGDTLFRESVGRTDFPTGSADTLVRSIREKLYVLPEETVVFPGHGGTTSIAYEKRHNYIVRAGSEK